MISNLQELIFHLEKSYEANIKKYNNVSIEFLKNYMEQYVGVDWKKYIDLTKPFNKNVIDSIKKYGISFKMLAPKIMKHYIIIIPKTVV